ncbi:MAG: hypothetical protein ABL894_11450 [Hyphomicrobium sp.]
MKSQTKLMTTLLVAAAAFFLLSVLAIGSKSSAQSAGGEVSGAEEFQRYCALCHGPDGRGEGRLTGADALNTLSADITQIATRNNGVFPFEKVEAAIRDGGGLAGHKGTLMLPWGKIFSDSSNPQKAQEIVREVTKYVESLQEK